MSCPHLGDVVDHASDLDAVAGLSGHAAQCGECGFALRILAEVEAVRNTEVPGHLAERAMAGIAARREADGVRAKPWEVGWAGLLGGLTVVTAALVTGRLGSDGTASPLAVASVATAIAAAWREARTVEAAKTPTA